MDLDGGKGHFSRSSLLPSLFLPSPPSPPRRRSVDGYRSETVSLQEKTLFPPSFFLSSFLLPSFPIPLPRRYSPSRLTVRCQSGRGERGESGYSICGVSPFSFLPPLSFFLPFSLFFPFLGKCSGSSSPSQRVGQSSWHDRGDPFPFSLPSFFFPFPPPLPFPSFFRRGRYAFRNKEPQRNGDRPMQITFPFSFFSFPPLPASAWDGDRRRQGKAEKIGKRRRGRFPFPSFFFFPSLPSSPLPAALQSLKD